jgi:hypothetical protein
MQATIESPMAEPFCCGMTLPRYPEIEVRVAKAEPLLAIAATRQALRRAGVAKHHIDDFSARAFTSDDPIAVCQRWVSLVVRSG